MSTSRVGFRANADAAQARIDAPPRSAIAGALAALGALFVPSLASAMPGGIATPNCDGCHAGGVFEGSLSLTPQGPFEPGQTADFVLTISDSQLGVAGFYLTTFGVGTLAPGAGARVMGGELMHQRPFQAVDGSVQITFSWTAPSGQGGVDFLLAVVAADGNGEAANDRVTRGGFSAVWGCPGVTLYRDIDGDGFGNDVESILRCESEPGWTETGGDCIDFRDTVWPGAEEVANGRDDDCDGEIDEGISVALLYPDRDGDGFGDPFSTPIEGNLDLDGYSPNNEDCDDLRADTNPDAEEVCDGRDQNCNDTVDEGTYEYCGVGRCLVRLDRCDRECVPLAPFPETCNGLDDDCDGVTDNGDLCALGEHCDGSCVADTVSPSAGGAGATLGGAGATLDGAGATLDGALPLGASGTAPEAAPGSVVEAPLGTGGRPADRANAASAETAASPPSQTPDPGATPSTTGEDTGLGKERPGGCALGAGRGAHPLGLMLCLLLGWAGRRGWCKTARKAALRTKKPPAWLAPVLSVAGWPAAGSKQRS